MKTRQILFTSPNVAELKENDLRKMERNDVFVKMEYTAISAGTERANLVGEKNINGATISDEVNFPRVLGYSGAGIVQDTGSDVTSVVQGDRVLVYFGIHSEYNVVPETNVIKIKEDSISLLEATFLVIAGFSIAGVRKTQLEIGESALVAGLGILGLFAVQFCKLSGAIPVIAVDPDLKRRTLALKLGADFALDPTEENYVQKIKEITDSKGVNAIIEVSGTSVAFHQSLECVAKQGRIALLGCTRNPVNEVDFYHRVHFPGVTIVGANNFARPQSESSPHNWTFRDDCEAMLKLLKSNRLDVKSLLSEVHSPTEAPEVYHRLAFDQNFPIGVAFDWSK
jgi:Threonine dehydrogenase and related Zn-dependent dehydrogenases